MVTSSINDLVQFTTGTAVHFLCTPRADLLALAWDPDPGSHTLVFLARFPLPGCHPWSLVAARETQKVTCV
jgi:hypothetical protein